jgi:hypothetical protein
LTVGPLRVHLGLDLDGGQAKRLVLGQHLGQLSVLAPGGPGGGADNLVGLGGGAAVAFQEGGDAAGRG